LSTPGAAGRSAQIDALYFGGHVFTVYDVLLQFPVVHLVFGGVVGVEHLGLLVQVVDVLVRQRAGGPESGSLSQSRQTLFQFLALPALLLVQTTHFVCMEFVA